MDTQGMGHGDRELLRAAQTGEGLVELTPELLAGLLP